MFMNIPAFSKDVKTRSFLSLVQSSPVNLAPPTRYVLPWIIRAICVLTRRFRAIFNTVTLPSYTSALMDAVVNETLVRSNLFPMILLGRVLTCLGNALQLKGTWRGSDA